MMKIALAVAAKTGETEIQQKFMGGSVGKERKTNDSQMMQPRLFSTDRFQVICNSLTGRPGFSIRGACPPRNTELPS